MPICPPTPCACWLTRTRLVLVRMTRAPPPADRRGFSVRFGAFKPEKILASEADRGGLAALGWRGAGVVEGVEGDSAFLEPDPDPNDGSQEAHFLDGAAKLVAIAALVLHRHRCGTQCHGTNVSRLGIDQTPPGDDLLAVDGDPTARRVDYLAAQYVQRADEGGDETGTGEVVDIEGG